MILRIIRKLKIKYKNFRLVISWILRILRILRVWRISSILGFKRFKDFKEIWKFKYFRDTMDSTSFEKFNVFKGLEDCQGVELPLSSPWNHSYIWNKIMIMIITLYTVVLNNMMYACFGTHWTYAMVFNKISFCSCLMITFYMDIQHYHGCSHWGL